VQSARARFHKSIGKTTGETRSVCVPTPTFLFMVWQSTATKMWPNSAYTKATVRVTRDVSCSFARVRTTSCTVNEGPSRSPQANSYTQRCMQVSIQLSVGTSLTFSLPTSKGAAVTLARDEGNKLLTHEWPAWSPGAYPKAGFVISSIEERIDCSR
jgi:hypothetical protein